MLEIISNVFLSSPVIRASQLYIRILELWNMELPEIHLP